MATYSAVVALMVGVAAAPAVAHVPCASSCRTGVAACRAACGGPARRSCMEGCRARLGCPSHIRTIAYVVTECDEDARGIRGRQALRIRRRDCDPLTAMELVLAEPVADPLGACSIFGEFRTGDASMTIGAFQRLGVTPDGTGVVFEANTAFALFPSFTVPVAQAGFYFVRADGTGLRFLGPPSREPAFRLIPVASSPIGVGPFTEPALNFSPDGRRFVFNDVGPGPAGEDATQIVTIDLATGRREQVTRLPFVHAPPGPVPAAGFARFLDDETITFASFADPDGENPNHELTVFDVRIDGSDLHAIHLDLPALAAGTLVPTFEVTGGHNRLEPVTLRKPGAADVIEVYELNRKNVLQLTNFGRRDTFSLFLGDQGRRVFLQASADPLGANATQNCQLFSIDTLGGGLRQLTRFGQGARSAIGCAPGPPPGCSFDLPGLVTQDPLTSTVVFESSCDPFGTNPFGSQIFAMRRDGSGLRQLTATGGFVRAPDGSVTAELPGPFAYPGTP